MTPVLLLPVLLALGLVLLVAGAVSAAAPEADADALAIAPSDTAPEWVRVAPWGAWVHPRTGPFEITPENADELVRNHQVLGTDIVVDFEHQTLSGAKAPAAGWITELERRDDGVWARVKWTEEARRMVEQKHYRYLSPVLIYKAADPRTGEQIGLVLHSVALTNTPLLASDMPALVAAKQGAPAGFVTGKPDLTPEDLDVCRLCGTDPAAFAQAKAEQRAVEALDGFGQVVCRDLNLSAGAYLALKAAPYSLTRGELELCRRLHTDPTAYATQKLRDQADA